MSHSTFRFVPVLATLESREGPATLAPTLPGAEIDSLDLALTHTETVAGTEASTHEHGGKLVHVHVIPPLVIQGVGTSNNPAVLPPIGNQNPTVGNQAGTTWQGIGGVWVGPTVETRTASSDHSTATPTVQAAGHAPHQPPTRPVIVRVPVT